MNCVNCKMVKGQSTLNGYCEKCFDTCFQLFPRETVGAKTYYYQLDEQGNKKEFWL
jgi:hypothetical protein